MKVIRIIIIAQLLFHLFSCDDYLDIVPDNVATIEYAFRMRATTQRYLFTCYSYLPQGGALNATPELVGADELWWVREEISTAPWNIARGRQNINSPYLDLWTSGSSSLWRGIRECNIFLENIMGVDDIEEWENEKWAAEVTFLKAYYHFYLLRMYGPIPIIRENMLVSASEEEVRVPREPVDMVVDYIIELMDKAIEGLPEVVEDENSELGRITLPIALGIKAKILVFAASPLFNGNPDYANYANKDGTLLFNKEYSEEKWQRAVDACKEAIDKCHELGYELYYFEETNQVRNISNELMVQMNTRNSFAERWNSEIIWAHTKSNTRDLQVNTMPKALPPASIGNTSVQGHLGVPFKIASLFYSRNGVPINEDVTWPFDDRFELRQGTAAEKYWIKEGYTTAQFNFDREARFYSTVGFDGGVWFGQGNYNQNDPYWLELKLGQVGGKPGNLNHTVTGYYPKKYIYYTNVLASVGNTYTSINYPWPMLRLSDLYLLYAEALNEVNGPCEEVFHYLDLIRLRAGLPGVEESWTLYSRNPNKFSTKAGLREIIQQERAIELCLEGQRFWDLRRWKTAIEELNQPISGWDMDQSATIDYYREKIIFNQSFSYKDYFWPIREYDLIVNKNLVQSPGW